MAIPGKGVNQIRTLSGRSDQLSVPYRSYMQISCLEMERARRNKERAAAALWIQMIDTRIEEIEKAEKELLLAVASVNQGLPVGRVGSRPEPEARRNTGGFKIRY